MKKEIAALAAIAALVIGVLVFATPSTSQAVTITSVSVTVGGTTWCDTTQACTHPIWNLGGGVVLFPASNSLVLTQTGGAAGFNFDTSEDCHAPGGCGVPSITVGWLGGPVGGATFLDNAIAGKPVLGGAFNGGLDPVTNAFNEATNWVAAGSVPNLFNVNLAYADNIHTDACADINANSGAGTGATTPSNCFPENPFSGATRFIGGGTDNNVFASAGDATHCPSVLGGFAAPGTNLCWDAGVIMIHSLDQPTVPEPSSLLLLGTGLLGLAAYGRTQLKKRA